MSFGFGVGDFLAVIELATKIRKRFADAPAHLQAVSDEVKSLSSLIQDVEVDITNRDMTTDRLDRLNTIIGGAKSVLEDLNAFLEKNRAVSDKGRANLKRIWSRFALDSGDVRDLRARLTTHVTLLSTFLDQDLRDTIVKVHEHMNEEDRQRILDWVSKEDHSALQANLLRRRQPGTRKWLLESREWTTWTGSRGLTLYCPGIPGAGKTFTTAMVIERLQQTVKDDSSIALSYAFCDYKRSEEHGVEATLMRLLLRGVLEQCSFPTELHRLYKSSASKRQELELDDALELFRLVSPQKQQVFLVVDALDELQRDQREMLVQNLLDLRVDAGFNLLFTSRKMGDISELFPPETMTVEIFATKEDVYSYLSGQMKLLPGVVRKNKQLQEEIQQTIVAVVEGMFLLAELHFGSLRGKLTAGAIRKALAELSNGSSGASRAYEQAYTMAMARIQEQDAEALAMAKRALLVLSHARRPFHSSEFCHALGIRDDASTFDEEDVPDIGDVLSLCAGLVIHQTETDIVELAHKSTRDYFESSACKWFPNAEEVMYRLCVTYIDSVEKSATRHASPEDFPFLDYSRKHYGDHGIAMEKLLLDVEAAGVEITTADSTRHTSSHGRPPSTTSQPLQVGLIQMTKELEGMTSILVWACGHQKHNIARMLLSSNFSEVANQIDEALEAAVSVGDSEMASMLLKFGADPTSRMGTQNVPGKHHEEEYDPFSEFTRPLFVQKEHIDPMSMFSLQFPIFKSALSMAAYYGQQACFRLLLDWLQNHANTSDDHKSESIFTAAILSAVAGGHHDFLSELLPLIGPFSVISEKIDDPSLFHLTCRWGDEAATTAILNYTAVYPDSRDSLGETPLSWAVLNEMLDVVRRLLESECADPNTKNGLGQPLLTVAVIHGNVDLVKILMKSVVLHINAVDNDNRSAISHAAECGNATIIELLLSDDKVQPNIADFSEFRTPLSWAIFSRQHEATRVLLQHRKITSHLHNTYRRSPLYWAVVTDNLDAVCLLLDQDLSGSRPDDFYEESLYHAIDIGAWSTLPILIAQMPEGLNHRSPVEGNEILHLIIAGSPRHEWTFIASSDAPLALWESLAKNPTFSGQVRKFHCSCHSDPLLLAISTGDFWQVKGLLLLDPELPKHTWKKTGVNPIRLAAQQLPYDAGKHVIDLLNETIPEASYLAIPHLLEDLNYDTTWFPLLSSRYKGTIDSRMLLDGFKATDSPLWRTTDHGSLFRACLAVTKKETFYVAFHRHEASPGPSLMAYLYDHMRWPRLLDLYDHCPALVRETARLGAAYSIDRAHESGDTLFIMAIRKRSIPTLKAMLALNDVEKVVNKPHPHGWTPLAVAVMTTSLDICKLLSAHPLVTPNIRDDEGFTPLHHAVHQASKWCHRPIWKRTDLHWLRQCVGIIELLYSRYGTDADLEANYSHRQVDYRESKEVPTATNMAKDLVSFLLSGSCADVDAKNHGDQDSILCLVSILKFLIMLPEEDVQDKRWCKDDQVVKL